MDKDTGINYILINTTSPSNKTKAGVIGTIAEEQSHIIGKIEGRQKQVPDGSEKGLESLGRPTNDYFKNQYSKNDKVIGIISDGRDYSNVDFGENVGDHYYFSLEDQFQYDTSEKAKMDDGRFVIVPNKKGDNVGEAIINNEFSYQQTDAYKFSKEGNNAKIISDLSKQAKTYSAIDPYNNYIVTVSREEGINLLKVPKAKSWKENISNDYNEAKGTVVKYRKKSEENWKNGQYLSAVGNRVISGVSVLNLLQTGIGTTGAQQLYEFDPGEVQYGKTKDILARRARAEENAKSLIDNSVSAIASAVIPNKIGGGTITIPEPEQEIEEVENREYYENGNLKYEGLTRLGLRTKEWKFYYENGKLQFIGDYKYGEQNGLWKIFYKNGNIKNIVNYDYGKLVGIVRNYEEDGGFSSTTYYEKDLNLTKWKFFYKDGKSIKKEGMAYDMGEEAEKRWITTGEWKYYSKAGKLEKIETHVDGKIAKVEKFK